MAAVSTAAGLLGLILPDSLPLVWLAALTYGLGCAWLAGTAFFPQESLWWRIPLGLPTLAVLWATLSGVTYHLYRLNLFSLILLALAVPAILLWAIRHQRRQGDAGFEVFGHSANSREATAVVARPGRLIGGLVLATAAVVLTLAAFGLLGQSATELSIRSPWDMVPTAFFTVFFLAALAAFGLAFSGALRGWSAGPLALVALLATSVAVLIYSVGYGFDPFIHQATEKIIYETGTVSPKPFYYAGQYALLVSLAKMSGLAIQTLDRWLLPLSFALLFPLAGWSLRRSFRWPPAVAFTAAGGLLLLPLTPFISTTPQGWANLLALAAFFLALPAADRERPLGGFGRRLPLVFAAAAAVTHPLTGLPLLVFVAAWTVLESPLAARRGWTRHGSWFLALVIALLGSLVLPAAFLTNAALSGTNVSWDGRLLEKPAEVITELKAEVAEESARRYRPALDTAYLWDRARTPAIWLLGLAGLLLLARRRRRTALAYAAGLLALVGNWLILKTSVNFSFLIDYERANYVDRLADLILYVLSPAAIFSLGLALDRIRRSYTALRLAAVVLLAALATSSLYLAYPRRDKYGASRGWSTSGSDVQAVKLIEADAGNRPYVVLANQSVSAAAIKELGFSAYYQSKDPDYPGPVYLYPVPTGDRLYQIFLEMNDGWGRRETAEKAKALTGAELAYYVVTDYWWQARQIVDNASREAEEKWKVGSGYVFRY